MNKTYFISPSHVTIALRTLAVFALPLYAPGLPASAQTVTLSPSSLQAFEQAAFNQVNQYRASKGLAPLSLHPQITKQARQHSQAMANGQTPFSHNGFDRRLQIISQTLPYRSAAENVAYNQGFRDPVTQAVQGWIKSTGHRRNMEGQFDVTGIGVAQNSRGEVYFTQIFIRRR